MAVTEEMVREMEEELSVPEKLGRSLPLTRELRGWLRALLDERRESAITEAKRYTMGFGAGWDAAIVAAAKEVESLLERGRTIRETAAAIRAMPYKGEATTPPSNQP